MPDSDWKENVDKKIEKAHDKGEIDDEIYEWLKRLLGAAEKAGEFAEAIENEGLLRKLGKKNGIGWMPAGVLIDILIQLVEAGPCEWVGVILARIHKLKTDALAFDQWDTYVKLEELKKKYSKHYDFCTKKANGKNRPKDINKATVMEVRKAIGSAKIAKAIVKEAEMEYFHTPWELLRVKGVNYKIISTLLKSGFYFGVSGPQMIGLMHLVSGKGRMRLA